MIAATLSDSLFYKALGRRSAYREMREAVGRWLGRLDIVMDTARNDSELYIYRIQQEGARRVLSDLLAFAAEQEARTYERQSVAKAIPPATGSGGDSLLVRKEEAETGGVGLPMGDHQRASDAGSGGAGTQAAPGRGEDVLHAVGGAERSGRGRGVRSLPGGAEGGKA